MEINIMDKLKIKLLMDMVKCFLTMDVFIKDNGIMVHFQDLVHLTGQMEEHTKVTHN